jgi:hypothetical protein
MSRYSKMRSNTASAETIWTCKPASTEAGPYKRPRYATNATIVPIVTPPESASQPPPSHTAAGPMTIIAEIAAMNQRPTIARLISSFISSEPAL